MQPHLHHVLIGRVYMGRGRRWFVTNGESERMGFITETILDSLREFRLTLGLKAPEISSIDTLPGIMSYQEWLAAVKDYDWSHYLGEVLDTKEDA